MLFLFFIQELSGIAEDVIIVTSSLTKDMTGKEDTYRAAAIRALCSITDVHILFVLAIFFFSYLFLCSGIYVANNRTIYEASYCR